MISEVIRRAVLAGLGIQEKFREMVDEFVKKGELSQSQGAKLLKEWTEMADKSAAEVNKTMKEFMEKTLEKMSLPSKDELDKLSRKVQSLSVRVKRLESKAEELEEKTEELEEEGKA